MLQDTQLPMMSQRGHGNAILPMLVLFRNGASAKGLTNLHLWVQ